MEINCVPLRAGLSASAYIKIVRIIARIHRFWSRFAIFLSPFVSLFLCCHFNGIIKVTVLHVSIASLLRHNLLIKSIAYSAADVASASNDFISVYRERTGRSGKRARRRAQRTVGACLGIFEPLNTTSTSFACLECITRSHHPSAPVIYVRNEIQTLKCS